MPLSHNGIAPALSIREILFENRKPGPSGPPGSIPGSGVHAIPNSELIKKKNLSESGI